MSEETPIPESLFSVVYIEHSSRHRYEPEAFSDIYLSNEAVHLGCMPAADPQINGHMILVPRKNLDRLCRQMSEFGQDAGMRVDSNGVAYLTDDAGRGWYRPQGSYGKDEQSPYTDGLRFHRMLSKVSCYIGMLERPSEPEAERKPPEYVNPH